MTTGRDKVSWTAEDSLPPMQKAARGFMDRGLGHRVDVPMMAASRIHRVRVRRGTQPVRSGWKQLSLLLGKGSRLREISADRTADRKGVRLPIPALVAMTLKKDTVYASA